MEFAVPIAIVLIAGAVLALVVATRRRSPTRAGHGSGEDTISRGTTPPVRPATPEPGSRPHRSEQGKA